ncbi:MAG: hypothetical protein M1831_006934 [Alyxoria varia]|nr:MAG: hypothetical protein M1831_006934 [Alyxoria varia]
MKLNLFFGLIGLLIVAVMARVNDKSIIVTYPEETPDSVIEQAKADIKMDHGEITHEYKLIKGFAAKVSEDTLQQVHATGQKHKAHVEKDQQLHAQGGNF